jgi:hypothetical protein
MTMTTFLLLAAVLGLPMVWAISSSSRRSYRDYDDGEWDRRYPHYPPYPYPPYPPRRRESESLLVLISLVLIILLAFIVVRYVYEKEEEKRIEKMRDTDWNSPNDEVVNDMDTLTNNIGETSYDELEIKESNLNISPGEAENLWFSQVGQYRTPAKAREQIKILQKKYPGQLWLGISSGFDTQSYKVLIGPFPSESTSREALKGDYPVRQPAQENIEIYRAD